MLVGWGSSSPAHFAVAKWPTYDRQSLQFSLWHSAIKWVLAKSSHLDSTSKSQSRADTLLVGAEMEVSWVVFGVAASLWDIVVV